VAAFVEIDEYVLRHLSIFVLEHCSANSKISDVKERRYFVFVCRFINARRRIVQPMIDQSNRAGTSSN